jgi:hypothetical protein
MSSFFIVSMAFMTPTPLVEWKDRQSTMAKKMRARYSDPVHEKSGPPTTIVAL